MRIWQPLFSGCGEILNQPLHKFPHIWVPKMQMSPGYPCCCTEPGPGPGPTTSCDYCIAGTAYDSITITLDGLGVGDCDCSVHNGDYVVTRQYPDFPCVWAYGVNFPSACDFSDLFLTIGSVDASNCYVRVQLCIYAAADGCTQPSIEWYKAVSGATIDCSDIGNVPYLDYTSGGSCAPSSSTCVLSV